MKYRLIAALALVALAFVNSTTHAWAAPAGWELKALRVADAHSISKGAGVTVAVIDTGIRTDHPAVKGQATEGPDFLEENDQDEPWYGEHGTSMASSVLDVAPEAEILGPRAIRDEEDPDYEAWKELRSDSGEGASLAQAIEHAVEKRVDVISMSLGSAEAIISRYDSREATAIQEALAHGIVVLASAGNSGDMSKAENQINYPAAYPGVIAVAATGPDGTRPQFSSVHNYNDIAAPGVSINSADIAGGRSLVNGTSSATALTAGTAALIVSKYPDLAPRQVEQVLQKTASSADQGHTPQTGYGTVDAYAALVQAGKLEPEEATLPVGDHNVDMHFGPGDDGTPRNTDVGRNPEDTIIAAAVGGPGLIAVVVGGILAFSGSRARRRSASGTPAGPR
jgi:subtilisin family serine protease